MRENFRAWEIEALKEMPATKLEMLKHLVAWGILAPNAHNIQPWRFKLDQHKNTITICLEKKRLLPISDRQNRQAAISLGCAMTNVYYAAHFYGWRCISTIIDGSVILNFDGEPFFPSEISPLLKAMKSRRVNRGDYQSQNFISEDSIKMFDMIAVNHGLKIAYIADRPTKIVISEIQFNADQFVMFNKDFRKELGECILPNDSPSGVGMPGNTLGLGDQTTEKLIKNLKGEAPPDPDLLSGNAYTSRDRIRNSPLLCVILGEKDTFEYWIKAGAVFEGIALLAEINGLSIAVHAAMIEVGFLNKMLRARLLTKNVPLVIFRIGQAVEERPHSPRLPLEEVIEII